MLYWKANFQIPNSNIQAAEIFAVIDTDQTNDNTIYVKYFSDFASSLYIHTKEFINLSETRDLYNYLLTLEEFINYTKVSTR